MSDVENSPWIRCVERVIDPTACGDDIENRALRHRRRDKVSERDEEQPGHIPSDPG